MSVPVTARTARKKNSQRCIQGGVLNTDYILPASVGKDFLVGWFDSGFHL
jgi:hypothetical protein